MTRTRLVLLIRCVTLLGLCAFTDFGLYWFASFAMAPLGLMMPVFSNNCTASCTSGLCNSNLASTTFSLTIESFADGTCSDCEDFNATYSSLARSDNCTWEVGTLLSGRPPGVCNGTFNNRLGVFIFDNGAGGTSVVGYLYVPSTQSYSATWAIGTSPADCCSMTFGPTALTFLFDPSTPTPVCDYTSATMTLVGPG